MKGQSTKKIVLAKCCNQQKLSIFAKIAFCREAKKKNIKLNEKLRKVFKSWIFLKKVFSWSPWDGEGLNFSWLTNIQEKDVAHDTLNLNDFQLLFIKKKYYLILLSFANKLRKWPEKCIAKLVAIFASFKNSRFQNCDWNFKQIRDRVYFVVK